MLLIEGCFSLIGWTGKGPMRGIYEERIRKLRLRRVAFRTMWLTAEEYPLLLGNFCIP